MRADDLFARYGGEEFAVVMPGLTVEQAAPIVERMRRAVAALELTTSDGTVIRVTASFGLTDGGPREAVGSDTGTSSESGLQRALGIADQALYRAKRGGRNRVSVEPSAVALGVPA